PLRTTATVMGFEQAIVGQQIDDMRGMLRAVLQGDRQAWRTLVFRSRVALDRFCATDAMTSPQQGVSAQPEVRRMCEDARKALVETQQFGHGLQKRRDFAAACQFARQLQASENVSSGFVTDEMVLPGEVVHELIAATEHLSAEQKLGIYARGYVARLLECMEAEFPALQHLLGEELFAGFAKAYLVHLPSSSPDLYDLGHSFPAFLQAARPVAAHQNAREENRFDLPAELAKLERAIAVAARKQGTEEQQKKAVSDALPFLFGSAVYKTPECLQLLSLNYSLVEFVRAAEHKKEAATPEKKPTLVAVSRHKYRIQMQELEHWQFCFLTALKSGENYT
ncbi:MAG: DUF2063 domain-containing protein, partial [Sphingobacteriales bacterium]